MQTISAKQKRINQIQEQIRFSPDKWQLDEVLRKITLAKHKYPGDSQLTYLYNLVSEMITIQLKELR